MKPLPLFFPLAVLMESVLFSHALTIPHDCDVWDNLCTKGTCAKRGQDYECICDRSQYRGKACDKIRTCGRGLQFCPTANYTYPESARCIGFAKFCDGTPDCPGGFEELPALCHKKCTNDQFSCANKLDCVPSNSRCDGLLDCLDNSDEKNCPPSANVGPLPAWKFNTDFERRRSPWIQQNTSRAVWSRTFFRPPIFETTGPQWDHTVGYVPGYSATKHGKYMYLKISQPTTVQDRAILQTSPLAQIRQNCSMAFWYHMFGGDVGTLRVNVTSVDMNSSGSTRFTLSGNQGDWWTKAEVPISTTDGNFAVSIEGVPQVRRGDAGVIAIDDIAFDPACFLNDTTMNTIKPPTPAPTTSMSPISRCITEKHCGVGGRCRDRAPCQCMRGWRGTNCSIVEARGCLHGPCIGRGTCIPVGSNDYKCNCHEEWSGQDCEMFVGQCRGGTVRCQGTGIRPRERPTCINHFQRCDGQMDCLDGWDESNCTVTCKADEFSCDNRTKCHQLESRCDRLVDCDDQSDEENCQSADSHLPQACKLTTDFEKKRSHWKDWHTADVDWTKESGETASHSTGPGVDHTTNTTQGTYMYLEASGIGSGASAILHTPVLAAVTRDCSLTLWYHMRGWHIGTLTVNLTDADTNTTVLLFSLKGNQGNEWHQTNPLPIRASNGSFYISIEATIGGWQGDIAIDDIVFDPLCCGPKPTLATIFTTDLPTSGTDRSTTDRSTTDRSTTDRSTTDRSTTERSTTDRSTTHRSTTERSTTERSTTERSTTDYSTTDHVTSAHTTDRATDRIIDNSVHGENSTLTLSTERPAPQAATSSRSSGIIAAIVLVSIGIAVGAVYLAHRYVHRNKPQNPIVTEGHAMERFPKKPLERTNTVTSVAEV